MCLVNVVLSVGFLVHDCSSASVEEVQRWKEVPKNDVVFAAAVLLLLLSAAVDDSKSEAEGENTGRPHDFPKGHYSSRLIACVYFIFSPSPLFLLGVDVLH
jgi:hypothetical protein